jgi:hypothetical protein
VADPAVAVNLEKTELSEYLTAGFPWDTWGPPACSVAEPYRTSNPGAQNHPFMSL